ncbi:hypothetical protein [Streptomyces sp. NBC_01707]|uniref:hypothetical protein n=1 Tax=Streptomyces sp. NBC_01707 TaxID=2975914 RepID=UPI00352C018F
MIDALQCRLHIGEDHARGRGELDVDLNLRSALLPAHLVCPRLRDLSDLLQLPLTEEALLLQALAQRGNVPRAQTRVVDADGLPVHFFMPRASELEKPRVMRTTLAGLMPHDTVGAGFGSGGIGRHGDAVLSEVGVRERPGDVCRGGGLRATAARGRGVGAAVWSMAPTLLGPVTEHHRRQHPFTAGPKT